MKWKRHIPLLALTALMTACTLDDEAATGPVYLKSLDLGEDTYAMGAFETGDGSTLVTFYGVTTSGLLKVDSEGGIIWRADLPENVQDVWASRPLSNGNILVYGFDGSTNGIQTGAVIFSPEGELLHSVTYVNQVGSSSRFDGSLSLDGKELSNGEIALVMPTIVSASSPTYVRLVRFDQELQQLDSRVYTPDGIVEDVSTTQITFDQDRDGHLIVQGLIKFSIPGDQPIVFVMKLDGQDYEPVYFESFVENQANIPSRVAAASDGGAVWTIAGPTLTSVSLLARFSVLFQHRYSIGTEIRVLKTGGPEYEPQTTVIKGFPKFGYIAQVRLCSDGGFILTGTCNINSNQEVPSNYRILLVKLDSNRNMEWMRFPETHSMSLGADAVEIPGGYLVSGSHFSHIADYNPLFFKIDYDGNLN